MSFEAMHATFAAMHATFAAHRSSNEVRRTERIERSEMKLIFRPIRAH
jgi:hypothetical protein